MRSGVGDHEVDADLPSPRADRQRPCLGPRRRGGRLVGAAVLGIGLLAVLVVVSFAVGSRYVPGETVVSVLRSGGESPAAVIVYELRVPRTVSALLVGAGLGVAGVLMQAITRNPFADPGLLGVNAGASAAVVCAIAFLGVSTASGYVWFALGGAALAAALVHLVGVRAGRRDAVGVVLAGIALGGCLSAFVGIITLLDDTVFESYRFWVVGSFERRELEVALDLAPLMALGLILAAWVAPSLNQLALGDDVAQSLGVRVRATTIVTGVAVTLLCGSATAIAGPLSFIGLLVAHVVRRVVGQDVRVAVPLAVLGGAALALASDIVGRLVVYPGEVEAGIVAAFVGSPVLLWLIVRHAR